MVESILNFILNVGLLGLGYFAIHRIFSKKVKEFHFSINRDGVKFDSLFK